MANKENAQVVSDRRQEDRRKAQMPFEGPDRRAASNRRSGEERRRTTRRSGDRV